MTIKEAAARNEILQRFADAAARNDTNFPDMEQIERIISSHGLYPVQAYAEAYAREAIEIYVGVAWGVGPHATPLARLLAWFRARWDASQAD